MHKDVQHQFDTRHKTFNKSARWITDKKLIDGHVKLAGRPKRMGLELCCGTGVIGTALKKAGWDMIGIDISKKMCDETMKHFPAIQGSVEELIFQDHTFDLVVMRQALFFLDTTKALSEIARVLKKDGVFILSQTVPFSNLDELWLRKVHRVKQAQMKRFFTSEDLEHELELYGFAIDKTISLSVRENITKWMKYAPEQSEEKKKQICNLILHSPNEYKKTRNVRLSHNEIFEDWHWVIFKTKRL